jgi:hypothetical protein
LYWAEVLVHYWLALHVIVDAHLYLLIYGFKLPVEPPGLTPSGYYKDNCRLIKAAFSRLDLI